MINIAEEKLEHIKRVNEIYSQSSSLQEAGNRLNLTRERVRQILAEGRRLKIINYTPARAQAHTTFATLKKTYTRESLIKELIEARNLKSVISKFNLTRKSFDKLLAFFKINENELHTEKFRRKWIVKYQAIVEQMGRHPSTTELQSNNHGKVLYNAVSRYWGNFSNFRKEFGIEKEGHYLTPESKQLWQDGLERGRKTRQAMKESKKELILSYLKVHDEALKSELMNSLKLGDASISIYLHELQHEGKIIKLAKDGQTLYSSLTITA